MRTKKIIPLLITTALMFSLFAGCNRQELAVEWTWKTPSPSLTPLTSEALHEIKTAYLEYMYEISIDSDYYGYYYNSISIPKYCGTFNGHNVLVFLYGGRSDETRKFNLVENVAGCRIDLAYNLPNHRRHILLIHVNSSFMTISEAYNQGYLSENDVREIEYHANFYWKYRDVEEWGTPPELTPLANSKITEINHNYVVYYSERYPNFSSPDSEPFMRYYGTYNGYEVVLMCPYDLITNDMQYIHIDDYILGFGSGTYQFLLHKDSTFISVQDAYLLGYLSDKDLYEIAYYNNTNTHLIP